jgi:GTP-binding protein
MTHWEYPEAVARFGRQLDALGIAKELQARGAADGDLVMVDGYDFEFNPNLTNPYIPQDLLDREAMFDGSKSRDDDEDEAIAWRPYQQGGFLDEDVGELVGFTEAEEWDMLDEDFEFDGDDADFDFGEDEVWMSQ